MENICYLVLGFAPGVFWLWILRRKDDLEPEPKHKVLCVYFLGCLSVVPVVLLRPALDGFLTQDGTAAGLGFASVENGPRASRGCHCCSCCPSRWCC